jgi:5S rRNA maturation endonuclease (ribonuclease M5)
LKPSLNETGIARSEVLKWLDVPAKFYLDKGYSANLLRKYDIGLYKPKNRRFSDRVVIPLYDKSLSRMLGVTARTINPQCKKCKLWHRSTIDCPEAPFEYANSCKWKHSPKEEFDISGYLFNFYNNLEWIKSKKSAIICESVGDALRLEDAGIKGSVAIFGTSLKDGQTTLLDSAGVQNLIVLLNNDEPGVRAAKIIQEKYRRYYRLYFPKLGEFNDIGDLHVDEVDSTIRPILEGLPCLRN